MLRITVPGSTANLGPGFDSVGLAVNRYLTLDVKLSDKWIFRPLSKDVAEIPSGKDNLVYQTAEKVADHYRKALPACSVDVWSNIPLARGLGSSAAAISAGIELADALLCLGMTAQEKVRLASLYEGHPDNVGASIMGGLVIGSHRADDTDVIHVQNLDIDIVVVIPIYEIKTKDARKVLPTTFTREYAVEASAISNMLVAALLTKQWKLAGKMMEKDLFHQPFRLPLIPEIEAIRSSALNSAAFGVAISGAGPTVICFAEKGKGPQVKKKLINDFPHFQIEELSIDNKGSVVTKNEFQEQM
ncbi:homoserine kinase [Cytobacillus sp. S13-E01]|uniref:homoserine kinase n=1 Tax=Cytobacillus sp. S13-E01 TaxID=3031326 RepID=UPI0023D8C5F3|nr:homoserine kinase [Cytobacillus sp. S13-E01]MDF0727429.1 homoserine kinase [Cytobacillus sp. S13-E01]